MLRVRPQKDKNEIKQKVIASPDNFIPMLAEPTTDTFGLFYRLIFHWETVKIELFSMVLSFLVHVLLKACSTSLFLKL